MEELDISSWTILYAIRHIKDIKLCFHILKNMKTVELNKELKMNI